METGFISVFLTILEKTIGTFIPGIEKNPERKIAKSKREFSIVRKYLKDNRGQLVSSAYDFYTKKNADINTDLIKEVPLLTKEEWLPEEPIEISKVQISLDKNYKDEVSKKTTAALTKLLPYCDESNRYQLYSDAIRDLDCPKYFSNNKSYRLIDFNTSDKNNPRMTFAYSRYFEHINIGEMMSYEYSKAQRFGKSTSKLLYRNQLGDPFSLLNRHVLPGTITLTIRHQPGVESRFFMHMRGANSVAVGMNTCNVIPAGEFQPSTSSIVGADNDFCFWHNIMREYSEELLGYEEHYKENGLPVNYNKPPFDSFNKALQEGSARCYYLGFGIDPLSLKGEILTVCIWDYKTFDEVFANIQIDNAEGTLITDIDDSGKPIGIPFTEENILRYIREESNTPPGLACLRLAYKHKDKLGLI